MKFVLAGDIGGTKTLLQIFQIDLANCQSSVYYQQRYASSSYPSFNALLDDFVDAILPYDIATDQLAACFAVAGPITQVAPGLQQARVTNLPWELDSKAIREAFHLHSVQLINDFEAIAHGLTLLDDGNVVTLQNAEPDRSAPKAILGAGTGLGVCQIIPHAQGYQVIASEGGHCDFAPGDKVQIALLDYLLDHYPHVSYDRILSGLGIKNIFDFLYHFHNTAHDELYMQVSQSDDGAALIARAYAASPLAKEAIDTFVGIYGAQAGNLALTNLAYGGVYIAGGIAPKLIEHIKAPRFIHAFRAKGRMSKLMEGFPVHVIMDEQIGVKGAAVVAAANTN